MVIHSFLSLCERVFAHHHHRRRRCTREGEEEEEEKSVSIIIITLFLYPILFTQSN